MGLLSYVRSRTQVSPSRADGGAAAASSFIPRPPRAGAGAPTGPLPKPKREPGNPTIAKPAERREPTEAGSYIPGAGRKAETTKNPGGKNAASWNINNTFPGIGAGRSDFSNNEPGRRGIDAI
jgi:hypothetical protein